MEDIYKLDIVPINKIAEDLTQSYRQQLSADGKNASGTLSNTSSYLVNYDGKILKISLLLEDYWTYVENDTQPHFPPIEAIERWITVKHIIPTTNSGKIPSTKQLAFLIARGISKNGTKPTKLLQQTIDGADDLINLIVDEIAKQLQEEINKEEI